MTKSTERFTSRVANYVRYRPHYPISIIRCLESECALTPNSIVADVGSGTGILSELFLANGNQVFGVEPNGAMREAAEQLLASQSNFASSDGTAEATGLPNASVDFVIAGQAFHWFDAQGAHKEFARILKPTGSVVLVWNERSASATPFDAAYEKLLETFAVGYAIVNHRSIDADTLREFFTKGLTVRTFDNKQQFDFDGLKGRLLSSSYAPETGHPQHDAMIRELRALFDAYETNGQVTIHYDTNVYFGHL
ncbi:MAG: class I SAM-dependent methyltransferase [Gemmatimonadaceae bacterium]